VTKALSSTLISHLLQPLDVDVFCPLEQVWSQIPMELKLEIMVLIVDKRIFSLLVAEMWPCMLCSHPLLHIILLSAFLFPELSLLLSCKLSLC